MKIRTLLLGLLIPAMVYAADKKVTPSVAQPTASQAQPTQPTQPKPTLNSTEKLAMDKLSEEFSQLQQEQLKANADLNGFESDIKKNHPGYMFDPRTGTLILDPSVEPVAPEKK